MSKKQEKKKETSKNEEEFVLEEALEEYVCPAMFKAGLKYYIHSNNLEPKSKKEFEKIVKDYGKLELGE